MKLSSSSISPGNSPYFRGLLHTTWIHFSTQEEHTSLFVSFYLSLLKPVNVSNLALLPDSLMVGNPLLPRIFLYIKNLQIGAGRNTLQWVCRKMLYSVVVSTCHFCAKGLLSMFFSTARFTVFTQSETRL